MLTFEHLNAYLLNKPETWLDYPFGEDVHVFKVKKKMFALVSVHQGNPIINLKCDPDEASALREIFANVTPGYHMDKRNWISVYYQDEARHNCVPDHELERLMDNSFKLVVNTMPKREQASITVHL